jgi:hypothetical protein
MITLVSTTRLTDQAAATCICIFSLRSEGSTAVVAMKIRSSQFAAATMLLVGILLKLLLGLAGATPMVPGKTKLIDAFRMCEGGALLPNIIEYF